jgi:hypothetical protein
MVMITRINGACPCICRARHLCGTCGVAAAVTADRRSLNDMEGSASKHLSIAGFATLALAGIVGVLPNNVVLHASRTDTGPARIFCVGAQPRFNFKVTPQLRNQRIVGSGQMVSL